jgi:cytochrome c6
MVLKFALISFLSLLLFSCGENESVSPRQEESEPLPQVVGKQIYLQHCAVCHGEDGKLGVSGAKDLSLSTLKDAEIVILLENGRNGMPPMKELIGTAENMAATVEHVKTLRK